MEATRAKTFGVVVVAKSGQLDAGAPVAEGEARGQREARVHDSGEGGELGEALRVRLRGRDRVTGCPRVAPDNQVSFPKRVLNMQECEELLKRL
jgi:hypothetical protein